MATIENCQTLVNTLNELYDENPHMVLGYLMGMVFLHVDDITVDYHLCDIQNEIDMRKVR